MYQKILVPLDLSKRAEAILPHVEQLAWRYDAKVVFLHVVEPETIFFGSEIPTRQNYFGELTPKMAIAETYLAEIKGRFQQKSIKAKYLIVGGSVPELILSTAENEAVDLVAIASHGRSGFSRVFYGSVAASVLHRIDRPLLLIRSR
jgi:nucleotide-binding universal stress UspA family protein